MSDTVIVTGSSGYIGGQTVLQLKDAGHRVIGIDIRPAPDNIKKVLDQFYQSDFSDTSSLDLIVASKASAIVHCAGTSLVGPSVRDPELYYENNFVRTKRLLDAVVANKSPMRVIFSSSAAVYGDPIMCPCQEEDPPLPISPYGESKHMVELLLQSYQRAYGLDFIAFRYFNAAGADPRNRHGYVQETYSHLVPILARCFGKDLPFTVFGNDYNTEDGTCIRDYTHVYDIAEAHIAAIDYLNINGTHQAFNIGKGKGESILDVINAFSEYTGKEIQYTYGERREGDPSKTFADITLAINELLWFPKYTLADIVEHAYKWENR